MIDRDNTTTVAPIADDANVSGFEDAAYITLTLSAQPGDPGSEISTFRITTLPAGGAVYLDAGLTQLALAGHDYAATNDSLQLYYRPNANFNGQVDLAYLATESDGGVQTSPADYYLSVDGLDGGSTAAGHAGAFEVLSYSLGESNPSSVSAYFGDLAVTIDGTGLNALLGASAGGDLIPSVQLRGVKLGDQGEKTVFDLRLEGAYVTYLQESASGGGGASTVSFTYQKIWMTSYELLPDGSLAAGESFGYDVVLDAPIDSPLAQPTPVTTGNAPTHPQDFFLTMTGMDGGSLVTGHLRAFEVSSFSFGDSLPVSLDAVPVVGHPSFDPLNVTFTGAALEPLLQASATGQVIASLQLQGVSYGAQGARTVYDLRLEDVIVGTVQQAGSEGSDGTSTVSFSYAKITLTTSELLPNGSLSSAVTHGYDLPGNAPLDIPLAAPVTAAPGGHHTEPADYFLTLHGMDGGSTAGGHEGAFEVLNYSFAEDNSGGGSPSFGDLVVTIGGTGLNELLAASAAGVAIPSLQLRGVKVGTQGEQTVYDLRLENVFVDSIQESASDGDGGGVSSVSFAYDKIWLRTSELLSNGSTVVSGTFGYNTATQVASTTPLAVATPVTTGTAPTLPQHFFLTMTGFDGGSLVAGHTDAFEVLAYSFAEANPATGGGFGHSGGDNPSFSALNVVLSGAAFQALFTRSISGNTIDALQLQGVSQGAQGAKTVYDLRLEGAVVESVQESGVGDEGSMLSVTFLYHKITVTTKDLLQNGDVSAGQTTGYDLATDAPLTVPLAAPVTGSIDGAKTVPADYYLAVDGMDGGSSASGHAGAFEVLSYSFGEANEVSTDTVDYLVGHRNFSELNVVIDGTGLTQFVAASTQGDRIDTVQLSGVKVGAQGEKTVYDLRLGDVYVTSVSESASDGGGGGSVVTLAFGTVWLSTRVLLPDGSLSAPQVVSYDLQANALNAIGPLAHADAIAVELAGTTETIGVLPTPVTDGNAPVRPQSFFLTIDGLDGGSVVAGHEGAFEILSYSLAEAVSVALHLGGPVVGLPQFSSLSVAFSHAALEPLLAASAAGASIDSLQLQGVSGNGQNAKIVYDLRLEGVHVESVQASGAEGGDSVGQVTFSFDRITITTREILQNGTLSGAQTVGYDLLTHLPIATPLAPTDSGVDSGTGHVIITVDPVNDGPILQPGNAIADQLSGGFQPFSLTLPGNMFADADGDTLVYAAKHSGGEGLPAWLSFDAATRSFSGTPSDTDAGIVYIRVTANDGHGAIGMDVFALRILSGYVLTGSAGADTLDGTPREDSLNGGAGPDTLRGYEGDDTLIGSSGADNMDAGDDDDVYFVDNAGDVAAEGYNDVIGGTDTVNSSVNHTLGYGIEILVLTGAAVRGTGNENANTITGNAAANVLFGLDGNDSITGASGDDTLNGGAGDDTLNGGTGADRLVGDIGNDSYFVGAGDVVVEAANAGTDTVSSTVGWTLGANLENLDLTGGATIDGTGNTRNNVLSGNIASNALSGGGGNDTLSGGASSDSLNLAPFIDTLSGGTGNDTYVTGAGDVLIELAGEGTDTVESTLSWTLGAEIERLVLTGAGAVNGTGNDGANTLIGNGAANVLSGVNGNDTLLGADGDDRLLGGAGADSLIGGNGADQLIGGPGNDTLNGGASADRFTFANPLSALNNLDQLTGFQHLLDTIELDDDIFTAFNVVVSTTIAAGQLYQAAGAVAAHDANDRIVYNPTSGALYYDADGAGGAGAIQFATLGTSTHPALLSPGDFVITA